MLMLRCSPSRCSTFKEAKKIRGNKKKKKRRATERQKGGRKREEVQTGMFLWVLGKDLG